MNDNVFVFNSFLSTKVKFEGRNDPFMIRVSSNVNIDNDDKTKITTVKNNNNNNNN